MKQHRGLTACLFIASMVLGPFIPSAHAAGLIEEDIRLAASFSRVSGNRTLGLEALVVRPDDDRRHPLAMINHGTPRVAADRAGRSARGMIWQAREFARRGWVAVVVMRRGYGSSEGDYVEGSGKCETPNYEASGRASAEDVREAIRLMKEKPYVDGSKVISVGVSAGGFATVALTADPPPGLVAAISFAGGRGSPKPNEVCSPDGLVKAFGTFGKTSRVPMLWVYAENDHYFSPDLAHKFHAAFTSSGGNAKLILAEPFGEDGHSLFSHKGTPIWSRYVDDFLAEHNLKLLDHLLPLTDIAGVHYPRGLSENGKEAFLAFLGAKLHKAFAMSANGHFGWRSGRSTPQEARDEAMKTCRRYTRQACFIVAIDNEKMP